MVTDGCENGNNAVRTGGIIKRSGAEGREKRRMRLLNATVQNKDGASVPQSLLFICHIWNSDVSYVRRWHKTEIETSSNLFKMLLRQTDNLMTSLVIKEIQTHVHFPRILEGFGFFSLPLNWVMVRKIK